MLGVYGIGLVTSLMHFVKALLRGLCSVGVHDFGRLDVVICVVYKCVFVSKVCMRRFGGCSGCRWVYNSCVNFISMNGSSLMVLVYVCVCVCVCVCRACVLICGRCLVGNRQQ